MNELNIQNFIKSDNRHPETLLSTRSLLINNNKEQFFRNY